MINKKAIDLEALTAFKKGLDGAYFKRGQDINLGTHNIVFEGGDTGNISFVYNGVEKVRFYMEVTSDGNIPCFSIKTDRDPSDIIPLRWNNKDLVTADQMTTYLTFEDSKNPAKLFGGSWECVSGTVLLKDMFYITYSGTSITQDLGSFDPAKSSMLISVMCTSDIEKARGVWVYTPNASNNYQSKQLTEIAVTNGYGGDTITASINPGIGQKLKVTTSHSGTWKITIIPLEAIETGSHLYIWRRV